MQFLPTSLNFLHIYHLIFMQLCFPKATVSCWALQLEWWSFFVIAKVSLFFLREAGLLVCSTLPTVYGAIMMCQLVFSLILWWARSRRAFPSQWPSVMLCEAPLEMDSWYLSPRAMVSKIILYLASFTENCFIAGIVSSLIVNFWPTYVVLPTDS